MSDGSGQNQHDDPRVANDRPDCDFFGIGGVFGFFLTDGFAFGFLEGEPGEDADDEGDDAGAIVSYPPALWRGQGWLVQETLGLLELYFKG